MKQRTENLESTLRTSCEIPWHPRESFAATTMQLFLACLLLFASTSGETHGQLVQRRGKRFAAATLVVPAPPRELRRNLERAERYVKEGRYTSAVELLDAILSATDSEDYFLPANHGEADGVGGDVEWEDSVPIAPNEALPDSDLGTTRTTLKTEACRILGSLPKQGREFYELQVGRTARRSLDLAVTNRDVAQVDEVSRRYFHTEAGYEATLLLARHALDNGLPTTAAIHLSRLRESAQSSKKYEPQLSVLLAVCRKLTRDDDSAAEILADARARFDKRRVNLAGEFTELPTNKQETQQFLDRLVGTFNPATQAKLNAWKMFRGGEHRNAESRGGMPLQKKEWSVNTALFISDEKTIADNYEMLREKDTPAIPVAQPLAIGDHLVMKAARMVLGVDFNSGRRIWSYPWNTEPEAAKKPELAKPVRPGIGSTADQMVTRIWRDFVQAQMSSDGELLYVLRSIKEPQRQVLRFGANQVRNTKRNSLVALELATEGKTIWLLGGDEGDDPALSEAFFLGVPLPIDDQLFVVVEMKDELRLLSLDKRSGNVLWSQQLGHIESSPQYQYASYPYRGLIGSCLAYSDGILICPTAAGTIVAIDTQRRWLLWSYAYQQSQNNMFQPRNQILHQQAFSTRGLGDQWTDAVPVIVDGRVIVTPAESDQLYCLNLITGDLEWRVQRGDCLFLAGAQKGNVVIVGPDNVRGIDVATGKPTWKTERFDDSGTTSGRGFYSDGHYYHPTTAKQILKINVEDGEIVESMESDFELGNLICHGDYVISQSHDAVHAFLQRDRIRPFIAKQLLDHPNDPKILENHASVLLGDGEIDEAIEALRRAASFAKEPRRVESIRNTISAVLLDRLDTAFNDHEDLLDEVRNHVAESNNSQLKSKFHQVVSEGYAEQGRSLEAFRELVSFADLIAKNEAVSEHGRDIRIDDSRQVHVTIWIAERLGVLLQEMNEEERAEALVLLEHKQAELATAQVGQARNWMRCISRLPVWPKIQLELANRYIANSQAAAAELLLSELSEEYRSRESVDLDVATTATANLVRLLTSKGELSSAQHALDHRKLSERDDSDDRTNWDELTDELEHRRQENKFGVDNWPRGTATWKPKPGSRRNRRHGQFSVKTINRDSLWPGEYRIDFDRTQLTVYDGYNRIRQTVTIPVTTIHGNKKYEVAMRGHVLVCSTGQHVFAVDLLSNYDESKLRVKWKHDISNAAAQLAFNRQQQDGDALFVHLRNSLGPVSSSRVAYLKRGNLVCVDLFTGETLWKVTDVGSKASLFGNRELVFVVNDGTSMATMFNMENGKQLKTVELPIEPSRWRAFGQFVMGWKTEKGELTVSVFDAATEEAVWNATYKSSASARLVNANEIAICQPDGRLEIRDVRTGRPIVQDQLQLEGLVQDMTVQVTPDQFIVSVSKKKIRRTGRAVAGFKSAGQLYAYDRRNGGRAWDEPTEVIDYLLHARQAVKTPMLVFSRSYTTPKTSPTTRATTVNEIACIDRRSGMVIFRNRQSTNHPFIVTANPSDATLAIEYRYGNSGHTIEFSEETAKDAPKSVNKLAPADVKPKTAAKSAEESQEQ